MTRMESTEPLESNPLTEKEGFEPSLAAKSHGTRLGLPSVRGRHG